MSDIVRAELFKLRKRPAVWVLLGVAVLITQLFAYVFPYVSYRSGDTGGFDGDLPRGQLLASTLPDQLVINSIGGFPVFAGALALVLGALMFGGEYGWGTVKTMLTQRPGRFSVLGGQLVALGIALFAGVVVMFTVSAAGSAGIALAEDRPMDWPSAVDLVAGVGAGWLVLAVWASLGAVLAVGLRGVALPIGLGVVWVLGIENLVSAVAGSVLTALQPLRDVLPGVNAGSLVAQVMPGGLVDPPPGVEATVSGSRALVTLACYVVVCAAAAAWTARRRDVA
jgi:ABC-type transport system involved in multi-copper enzyme maturation permease subunit